MRRRSEKYVIKGSKYAHWTGLYLSFHLSQVLGPFVHGRLQNLKTSEDTLGHDITTLMKTTLIWEWCRQWQRSVLPEHTCRSFILDRTSHRMR